MKIAGLEGVGCAGVKNGFVSPDDGMLIRADGGGGAAGAAVGRVEVGDEASARTADAAGE